MILKTSPRATAVPIGRLLTPIKPHGWLATDGAP